MAAIIEVHLCEAHKYCKALEVLTKKLGNSRGHERARTLAETCDKEAEACRRQLRLAKDEISALVDHKLQNQNDEERKRLRKRFKAANHRFQELDDHARER